MATTTWTINTNPGAQTLNVNTIGTQLAPEMTMVGASTLAAVYGDGSNVVLRTFAITQVAGYPVATPATHTTLSTLASGRPQVVGMTDGTGVAVWIDNDTQAVLAQRFGADGLFIGGQITLISGDLYSGLQVAAMSDGGFVATWEDTTGAGGGSVNGARWQGGAITPLATQGGAALDYNIDLFTVQGGRYGTLVYETVDSTLGVVPVRTHLPNAADPQTFQISGIGVLTGGASGVPQMAGAQLADGRFVLALKSGATLVKLAVSSPEGLITSELFQDLSVVNAGGTITLPALATFESGHFLVAWVESFLDGFGNPVWQVRGSFHDGNADTVIPRSSLLLYSGTGAAPQTLDLQTMPNGQVALSLDNIGDGDGTGIVLDLFRVHRTTFAGDTESVSMGIDPFADDIYGGGGANTLTGGGGHDVLLGLGGNDTLNGDVGDDRLFGGADSDTLNGGAGADYMEGGTGNDFYFALIGDTDGDQIVEFAGGGTDTVYSQVLDYTLPNQVENLTFYPLFPGAIPSFTGRGNALANVITGGVAGDFLFGNDGNDTLIGGAGGDVLSGGVGNDTASYAGAAVGVTVDLENAALNKGDAQGDIWGGFFRGIEFVEDIESITGSDHDDWLYGQELVTRTIAGLPGQPPSTIVDQSGNNVLNGYTGNDHLFGRSGDDLLLGDKGSDELDGGSGNDTLNGGGDADTMRGGAGNDTYHLDNFGDVITELVGQGTDTVLGSTVNVRLDTMTSAAGVEHIVLQGSLGISGIGHNTFNTITGNDGGNYLAGLGGNDTLAGGGGGDTVFGGDGKDTLTGGLGNDVFVYTFIADSGGTQPRRDVITDFSQIAGNDDWIDLSAADANGALPGNQAFVWLGTGAFTGAAGELRYFQDVANNRTIIEGQVRVDAASPGLEFSLELTGLKTLTAGANNTFDIIL